MAEELKCYACGKPLTRQSGYLMEGAWWCEHDYRKASALKDPLSFGKDEPRAPATSPQPSGRVERRYGATRAMCSVMRVVAVLVLAAGVLQLTAALEAGVLGPALGVVAAAGLAALLLLAGAEGLQVVLDMEEHQRALRQLAEQEFAVRQERAAALER